MLQSNHLFATDCPDSCHKLWRNNLIYSINDDRFLFHRQVKVFSYYREDCYIDGRLTPIPVEIKIDLIGDTSHPWGNFQKPLQNADSIKKYLLKSIETVIYNYYNARGGRENNMPLRASVRSCWQEIRLKFHKSPDRWALRPCPYDSECCVFEYFIHFDSLGYPIRITAVNEINRGDPDSCMPNLCYYACGSLSVGDTLREQPIILQNDT